MKKYKNRIVAGIILGFLILLSIPAMAENVTLNPIPPTTAGSFQQITWSSTGAFEPNASLDLFSDGILNRTIVSETPLSIGSYYWAIPLSLQGLYQINITAITTIGQELTNSTDIEITTPTADGCRYCHTSTGTNNSGVFNNTLGGVATRHHNLVQTSVINPMTNTPYACADCHPVINNTLFIDHNCLDCHNGTAFWADSVYGTRVGNFSEPHLNIPQPIPVINSVSLSTYTPNTGDNILVAVNVTDGIPITSVTANGVPLTKQYDTSKQYDLWNGTITAIEGTHSVNVSASDNIGHITWDNSTSSTAITPNIIVTSPRTGDNWVRGTKQTIRWTYTGDLGNSATVELLKHDGRVEQTWSNVPQANGAGSLEWTIPSGFEVSTYQIRVSAGGYSNTTGDFNIVKR